MNKSKLTGYIAVGLLISNLALIAFIFFGRKPSAHEGPRDIIIERLHFDQKQVEAYDILITAHRKAINDKQGEMLKFKNRLYSTLVSNDTVPIDSLESAIGNIQIDIEKINYNHFHDIQQLCKPDHKESFELLIKDIAELFRPIRRPGN